MRFAAALTATGLLSFLVIEIAKILLAPLAAYLLGIVAVVVKFAAIALGVLMLIAIVAIGIYVYRRLQREPAEV